MRTLRYRDETGSRTAFHYISSATGFDRFLTGNAPLKRYFLRNPQCFCKSPDSLCSATSRHIAGIEKVRVTWSLRDTDLKSRQTPQENHMAQQSAVVAFTSNVEPLTRARDWALTVETFELLLKHLNNDRDEAARKYVSLYSKLLNYFDWRGCDMPDWLADETMVRIARKISQGAVITNFQGFMFGVARNIAVEAYKQRERQQSILADLSRAASPDPDTVERDDLLTRLEAGLFKLAADDRELLLGYYSTNGDTNMKHRLDLAQREGISINALRVRVHRLRITLEKYVTGDVKDHRLETYPRLCAAKPTA